MVDKSFSRPPSYYTILAGSLLLLLLLRASVWHHTSFLFREKLHFCNHQNNNYLWHRTSWVWPQELFPTRSKERRIYGGRWTTSTVLVVVVDLLLRHVVPGSQVVPNFMHQPTKDIVFIILVRATV